MPAVVKNYETRSDESPSFTGIPLCSRDFVGFFYWKPWFCITIDCFYRCVLYKPRRSERRICCPEAIFRLYKENWQLNWYKKSVWNHEKSLEITRNHWKSLEISGNHWKSLEITRNHEKSQESPEINGNHRNHRKSMEITGNHQKNF